MSTLFSHFFSKYNEIRPQYGDFTEELLSIAVTPKMLYFYGKMPEMGLKLGVEHSRKRCSGSTMERNGERPKALAIVGTRKPTKYGSEVAYKLAFEAAKRGVIIVSGLAYGIDSIAARGALDAGGVTLAVLGTPIDQIYPRDHIGLAAEIVEKGGAVISEVPAGTQVGDEYAPGREYQPKTCFLERNRLISGLADAVVIPEAAERSGSLNTAAHALEQGKEIFAVPGDISRPMSKGCNRLILQGATPYLGPEDVLNFLFPPIKQKRKQAILLFGDSDLETRILRELAEGRDDGEEMINRLEVSAVEFSQVMTMLEIKGRVKALGCNRWMLL